MLRINSATWQSLFGHHEIASASFVSLAMTWEITFFPAVPGILSNPVIVSAAKQSQAVNGVASFFRSSQRQFWLTFLFTPFNP